ncbi:MAG: hypothetical protein BalsKO_12810 [Balneolaceae bacterium]
MKKILILLVLTPFINVEAQTFYTETGSTKFTSSVPLHDFSGTSENLVGQINLEEKTVDFYIDLETLDTGNAKRDKDMLLTLETKKHPFAEFFGKLTSDFDLTSSAPQEVVVNGLFKIHGEEKEVEVTGTLTKTDSGLELNAAWVLLLEDYNIVPPKLLFIKVDQEQKIEINALLEEVSSEEN